ncbi:hypothetical protein QVD17_39246 [Tagetes erecta]|uniref:Uncharacterized protein n=1 Tax=Tagetes erecta TaxID=13708 RepID=A0AAD8NGY7_TARER|nr:hypothetical protein QVD17_39246 [Tagetes erecta]
MKLRIVRLWKLPDHINKKEVYSIEMILMDEEFGFSFTSFKAISEEKVREDLSIDVIGERPSNVRNLIVEYAEQFIEYLQKHPDEVRLIVILQFERIKWWQGNGNIVLTEQSSHKSDELYLNSSFFN